MGLFSWLYSLIILFFFFFVTSLSSPSPPPLCHPHESSALLHFKNSFTFYNDTFFCMVAYRINNPNNTISWNKNMDCCRWSGVTCDEVTAHIIRLDLTCSGLQGILHSNNSLFSLVHLQSLILSHNDFDGSKILSQFGKFSNMVHLDLSHSYFIGQAPLELSHLSNLVTLDLSWNDGLKLETSSWKRTVANLTNLKELFLSDVDMSSTSPDSFMNLSTSLTSLDLSWSSLQGELPENVLSLPNLQQLDLSRNPNLNGSFPQYNWSNQLKVLNLSASGVVIDLPHLCRKLNGSIQEFQHNSLEFLKLSSNNLQGSFPRSIFQQVNLTNLLLSSNNLSDVLQFDHFSKLKNLQHLDLSDNSLSLVSNSKNNDTLPNTLSELYLSSCGISEFPYSLRGLEILIYLDLSNNQIEGSVPKWLWNVGHLPIPPPKTMLFSISNNTLDGEISHLICNLSLLEVLDLSNNNLSGNIPPCLGNSSLSVLDLHKNKLHGIIPSHFPKESILRDLNLNENQLEGSLPKSLFNCKELEFLDIGNNKINGSFPWWLESLPNLQALILRSNRFQGSIGNPKVRHPFQNLRIMDLSGNEFTGHLPQKYFENFVGMMNATSNYLSYMQATSNFTYYEISLLTIKGNYIELEKIQTMLIVIDFSRNNFTGEIPKLVGKLNSLKGLNFSHNKISGNIPPSLGNLTNLEWLDLSSNELAGKIPWQLAANLYQLQFLNLSVNQLEGLIPRSRQFDIFTNDSYKKNFGLCGFPISESCNEDTTP
ncbi:receptor-like protein 9DC3 [Humulus lupulus]|uniref:receptor-like protein 9DC3 n=1 Tax=Humulus lupulus TaxID=3486 RepID=UPI002B40BE21|nr:receptor-like protein 9DC3 [Humulus lupulus]